MKLPINKIVCGDCLEFMKDWPDNCIDLVVTSPPYGDLRDYRGFVFNSEKIARELFRIIANGGVVVWVVGDKVEKGSESGISFQQALYFKSVGFCLYDTMIYQKDGAPYPSQRRYMQEFEYMFIFSKNVPKTFNPLKVRSIWYGVKKGSTYRQKEGGTKRKSININEYKIIGNIWKIPCGYMKGSKDIITFEHPASFPDKLAIDHIVSWSNKNDIVLDPMCGSGTTCVAAKMLVRKYIGIDISKKYCEISRKRLKGVRPSLFEKPKKKKIRASFGLIKKK